jgi:hypothetical protein
VDAASNGGGGLAGVSIAAGSYVSPRLWALNRRDGAHRCPGNFLARTALRAVVTQWLRRIPEFDVEPGFNPPISDTFLEGSTVSLLDSPPLRWGPLSRLVRRLHLWQLRHRCDPFQPSIDVEWQRRYANRR